MLEWVAVCPPPKKGTNLSLTTYHRVTAATEGNSSEDNEANKQVSPNTHVLTYIRGIKKEG